MVGGRRSGTATLSKQQQSFSKVYIMNTAPLPGMQCCWGEAAPSPSDEAAGRKHRLASCRGRHT